MNTRYVLKIFSYDNGFILNSLLDDYESLSVKYNKYQSHELNITINRNIPNTQDLKEGNFIWLGSVQDGMFLITTVTESIDENGKGGNYINVQAKDCRYLYKRRMIMAINSVETWTETGSAEKVLRDLISSQTVGKRSLPITNTIPASPIGNQISLSEVHTNLYDVICNYCQQSGLGWKVDFDGEELTLNFYVTTDISQLVKFDVKYESLKNGEFEESSENYKNVVYVGGQGKGSNQAIYEAETEIEGESPSGLDRFELWDSQSSLTTEEELQKAGESKLIEFSQKLNFSGAGLEKSPFEFRVHYDIGNIVEVSFDNRKANVEIISVQESWAFGEYTLDFEFGKPLNTLGGQISKLYNWLQKYNSTDGTTTSGVKYYTIPTDTSQPIGDVTLDTIGFIGDTGNTDKTFQLYFNPDGTGAKTYHVYFKQLAGTGKLILTTGVSGKTNLEFNGGTYVSIIDVDKEGNVMLTIGIQDGHISSNSTWSSEKTQTELNGKNGQITITDDGGDFGDVTSMILGGNSIINPTSFVRRPALKLWNYIKGKVQAGLVMTGLLKTASNRYWETTSGGLDMSNSDIVNANVVRFGDPLDFLEGFSFPRSIQNTKQDTMKVLNGELLLRTAHDTGNENGIEYSFNKWIDVSSHVTLTTISQSVEFTLNRAKFYLCGALLKCNINVIFRGSDSAGSTPLKLKLTSDLFTTQFDIGKTYYVSYYSDNIWTVGFNVYNGENDIFSFRPNYNFHGGEDASFSGVIPVILKNVGN